MTDSSKPHAAPPRDADTRRGLTESLRLLVDSVRDCAIFLLDPDGNVASWNSGAARLKGYSAPEIIGRHFSIFYPAEDVIAGKPELQLQRALRDGRAEDEGWRLRKDGTRFWVNAIVTPLYENNELRGFAKVTRDLTERRAREHAERLAALHEEASRVKDEFLAMLSHELRTPLNVIVGEVWRLRHGHLSPGQQARAWEALDRNVRLQARIIDDLLDTSRIVSEKVSIEHQRVELVALLEQLVDECRRAGQNLTVELHRNTDAAFVDGDPARLQQIFSNLMTNALKFTPSGGRVDVTIRHTGARVDVSVKDTGIGIAPAFVSHVFDRFTQADSSARRMFGGLGLGLSIVKHLVELHGGSVHAHSDGEGRGATFTVSLPALTA